MPNRNGHAADCKICPTGNFMCRKTKQNVHETCKTSSTCLILYFAVDYTCVNLQANKKIEHMVNTFIYHDYCSVQYEMKHLYSQHFTCWNWDNLIQTIQRAAEKMHPNFGYLSCLQKVVHLPRLFDIMRSKDWSYSWNNWNRGQPFLN